MRANFDNKSEAREPVKIAFNYPIDTNKLFILHYFTDLSSSSKCINGCIGHKLIPFDI